MPKRVLFGQLAPKRQQRFNPFNVAAGVGLPSHLPLLVRDFVLESKKVP
jgi:hypothetical protein